MTTHVFQRNAALTCPRCSGNNTDIISPGYARCNSPGCKKRWHFEDRKPAPPPAPPRKLRTTDDRRAADDTVQTESVRQEGVTVSEESFAVLGTKIENLTKAIEKLDKRIEADTGDIFERLRKVEQKQAVTETKLWVLFTVGTIMVSTVVSTIASLIVFYLKSKP